MGIIYFKHFNSKINKFINDRKYKNKMNEYIEFILSNNGDITPKRDTIILNCKKDNKTCNLKITKGKNNIEYIYSKEKYQEKAQFYKIDNKYITKYIIIDNQLNEEKIETSIFNDTEQEILKIARINNQKSQNENKLVNEQEENIYIRTHDNNVILIENNDNKIKYYIGINEDKYETYIPRHIIYNEIEEIEYIELLNNKIKEEDLLSKYFLFEKK